MLNLLTSHALKQRQMLNYVNSARHITKFQIIRKLSNPTKILKVIKNGQQWKVLQRTNFAMRVKHAVNVEGFHTSSYRRALHPFIFLIVKPLVVIASFVFGRLMRRSWMKLPPEKRNDFKLWLFKHKLRIAGIGAMGSLWFMWFYVSHLEKDPITGRLRFIMLNEEQVLEISTVALKTIMVLVRDSLVPDWDPDYRRVERVTKTLFSKNEILKELNYQDWEVLIIDAPDVLNAMVIPTGHILVYTGILDLCSNDDQLCIVISHELAHILLKHVAEQLSQGGLIDMMLLLPYLIVWTLLPLFRALVLNTLAYYFTKLLFELPFSRTIELEADRIGLLLAATACYDVREASVLWKKIQDVQEKDSEWRSTHPSSERRQAMLDSFMSIALEVREACNVYTKWIHNMGSTAPIYNCYLGTDGNIYASKEHKVAKREPPVWLSFIGIFFSPRVMTVALKFGLAAYLMHRFERLGFAIMMVYFAFY